VGAVGAGVLSLLLLALVLSSLSFPAGRAVAPAAPRLPGPAVGLGSTDRATAPSGVHALPAAPAPATSAPGFHVRSSVPGSWGSHTPPGWEYLARQRAQSASIASGNSSAGSYSNWLTNWCYGLWPSTGQQSAYLPGCYGHDEPGIQFYSTLPGSGGNVSWNVTLPVSRGPTQNQSDLYSAIWFGLTLAVPDNAWMNQCFLELQFYPDSSWYAPGPTNPNATVYGNWVGAAVGWQIQAQNGREDPCYYAPLYQNGTPGPAFLNMSQGDRISVVMTGWAGDPTGESIAIVDQTNGERSSLSLYNASCAATPARSLPSCGGDYPLDPAYSTNSYSGSLQWTPGGEDPVVFAFEIGHAGNPSYPSNDVYGGCNPGLPGASFGGTPCPSYDPGSWTNDTLSPWQFSVPTFFNASAHATAAQVAFSDPQGGLDLTNGTGGGVPWSGACAAAIGTAYCSYPWYSYYCATHSFEFGATDFPGVTADFRQSQQYAETLQSAGAGFAYYAPTNFTIPTCGAPRYTVTVGASGSGGATGSAYFLSADYAGATAVAGVGPGEYPLAALAANRSEFRGWSTTGAVRVLDPLSPATTLVVAGTGSAVATFGTTAAANVTVTLVDSGAGGAGWITLTRATGPQNLSPIGTFPNGSRVTLPTGRYGIEGFPPAGYNFTAWRSTSGGVLSATTFPFSTLVVNGSVTGVTVTAGYTPSVQTTYVAIYVQGNGTVTFQNTSVNSSAGFTLGVGSYLLNASPDAGWAFSVWSYGGAAVLSALYAPVAFVNLEGAVPADGGYSYVFASFAPVVPSIHPPPASRPVPPSANATLDPVTFVSTAPTAVAGVLDGTPMLNDETLWLSAGRYPLRAASTVPGTLSVNWSATANLALTNLSGPATTIVVSGPGTVSALPSGILLASSVSPTGAEVGGRVTFRANATPFVLAPWSMTWNGTPPGCTGPGFAGPVEVGLTCQPSASGVYNVSVRAAFLDGALGVAGPTTPLFVGPRPAVAIAFSPAAVDVGAPTRITVTGTGGSLVFENLPAGCPAPAFGSELCIPTAAGVYDVTVNVTDPLGGSAHASANLSVAPPLAVATLGASAPSVTFGTAVTLTSTVVGGSGPVAFTWSGLPPDCAAGDAPNVTCASDNVGLYAVLLNVTDAGGGRASAAVSFAVDPPPAVRSFGVSDATPSVGSSITFAAIVDGGTGPLAYAYSGLPSGCPTAPTAPTFACTPTAAGTYTVHLLVTDSDGVTTGAIVNVTVGTSVAASGGGSGMSLAENVGIAALAAIVGALLTAAVLNRRRGARPASARPAAGSASRPAGEVPPPKSA
jgi:hypothetical protein